MIHDVVVVGGGPAGCYTASLLSKHGLDVHVVEEHPVIGEPVDCSGVIGAEAFAALGLPDHLKLGEISALTLVSPSDLKVHFSPPTPLAEIVDRAAFDQAIADKMLASGVTIHLGSPVIDLQARDEFVEVTLENAADGSRALRASVAILAAGPRFRFQRKLGMGEPAGFLKTAQAEIVVRGIKETKVFMGSRVAPGSFAWIVPFQRGDRKLARVGVSARITAVPYLRKLLERLCSEGHLDSPDVPVRSWVIPITPLPRTYSERVLAVGDAAGQTKPTTGGGIYYGLLCAEAAARTVIKAFQTGDFSESSMGRYEKEWRSKLGREIKIGAFFRMLAERLTDVEIDDLFRIVQSDGILASIRERARFDWHKDVIYFALRHPALGRVFLKGLFR